MTEAQKLALAAAAAVLVVAGAGVFMSADNKDFDPTKQTPEDAALLAKAQPLDAGLDVAVASGRVKPSEVFALKQANDSTVFASVSVDATGAEVVTTLPDSPCRARPPGVAVSLCSKVCKVGPHGEKAPAGPCDSGDNVRMLPGDFVDNGGCVPVACTVVFGRERFK